MTARNRRRLQYILRRKHENTCKHIFEDSVLHDVPKTLRNLILKTIGKFRTPPPKNFIVAEAQGNEDQTGKKCMKLDIKHVIFPVESRITLDDPDS